MGLLRNRTPDRMTKRCLEIVIEFILASVAGSVVASGPCAPVDGQVYIRVRASCGRPFELPRTAGPRL